MNATDAPDENNDRNRNQSMQSKGGETRAKRMSQEERSESAQVAAKVRWAKAVGMKIPKATHMGDIQIDGVLSVTCANLDNGDRVISDRSLALGLDARGGGGYWKKRKAGEKGAHLPEYLSGSFLKPFISEEMIEKLSQSITYQSLSGDLANGIKAEMLPQICDIWITANAKGALNDQQKVSADRAYMLMKAFATVGVIALVDEATGFQYERPRRDLEEQLKKFLSEELRRYVGAFPTEYFKHLCRLRGVVLRPDMRLPLYFGTLTNNLIYRRIAPGLLLKLKERKLERGKPSNKLYNWLSEDVGFRELLIHMGQVIGTMKRHTTYEDFERDLNMIAPPYPETPGLFDDPKDWEPRA
jgi:hypothetical protein